MNVKAKKVTLAPRPPAGDGANGEPSVIRVAIGGPDEWHRLWMSIATQLAERGVSIESSDRICSVLEQAYLRWCPGRAVLIDEMDRHTALPRVEELAALTRVVVNGLFFELLRREIEIHRLTERKIQ